MRELTDEEGLEVARQISQIINEVFEINPSSAYFHILSATTVFCLKAGIDYDRLVGDLHEMYKHGSMIGMMNNLGEM